MVDESRISTIKLLGAEFLQLEGRRVRKKEPKGFNVPLEPETDEYPKVSHRDPVERIEWVVHVFFPSVFPCMIVPLEILFAWAIWVTRKSSTTGWLYRTVHATRSTRTSQLARFRGGDPARLQWNRQLSQRGTATCPSMGLK